MATVVVIITTMVVANATQTITTPNAVNIPYNLAAGGGTSAPITPASNRSVLVMGCTTNLNFAVGQVSLLHIPGIEIDWVGLESQPSATITQGSSNTPGTHIVYIDTNHRIDIQVASADTIRIHNSYNVALVGNVTLIW